MLYLRFEIIVKNILSIKLYYYFLLGFELIPFVEIFQDPLVRVMSDGSDKSLALLGILGF